MSTGPSSHSDRHAFIARFAAELERLAGDLDQYQGALASIAGLTNQPELTMRAQGLDELVQRTVALADIARRYAEDPALTRSNALAGLTLDALARRLAGKEEALSIAGGEVDLF
ncbi:MAG TPA: hypothetical protein VGO52_12670 [Hyphomonadaceae bacterium]|jgi:hypothetical protein|nr:hypothetical protein [Hyphomonadaceae bacterium]